MEPDIQPDAEAPVSPAPEINNSPQIHPIARRRRRLLAFVIDSALLGITGQILGWGLSPLWFSIGPYARIVGFGIAFVYFATMNSRIGGGATFGKRILRLAVRGADGETIGVGRSLARSAIFVGPALFNGWSLPILENAVAGVVVGVIVFGIGGALVLTMLFNRRTRQGLHDLIARTYVVRMDELTPGELPKAGRMPWVLACVALAIPAGLMVGIGSLVRSIAPSLEPLAAIQEKLDRDPRFFSVSVNDHTFSSSGQETRTLRVRVWQKGIVRGVEKEKIQLDLAAAALAHPKIAVFDDIRVEIVTAYDLGIASGSVVAGDHEPVAVWRQRIDDERRRVSR